MSKLPPKLRHSNVDPLWSKAVKDRDGWKCQLCGKDCGKIGGHAHAHHIMRKQSTAMRYNLENGICLCAGCHKFGVHSPDGEISRAHVDRIEAKVGPDRWERIRAMKANPPKMKIHEAYEKLGGHRED